MEHLTGSLNIVLPANLYIKCPATLRENVIFKDDFNLSKRKEGRSHLISLFFSFEMAKYVPMFKQINSREINLLKSFLHELAKLRGIFYDLNGFEVFMFK